jgi:rhodanese-related sulfurtransferase
MHETGGVPMKALNHPISLVPAIAGLIIVLSFIYVSADTLIPRKAHAGGEREVLSVEAYAMWKSDPHNVKILDVRTRAEYALTGHPPMAHNIPLAFWTNQFEHSRRSYVMTSNPDFLVQVEKKFGREETLLLLCRSGQRSGTATTILRNAGFNKAYNILDGFQGLPDYGGGWKHSGAPWTYELDPALIYSP